MPSNNFQAVGLFLLWSAQHSSVHNILEESRDHIQTNTLLQSSSKYRLEGSYKNKTKHLILQRKKNCQLMWTYKTHISLEYVIKALCAWFEDPCDKVDLLTIVDPYVKIPFVLILIELWLVIQCNFKSAEWKNLILSIHMKWPVR